MSKVLITSGCSFSECISTDPVTWPRHLYRTLEQCGFDKHISAAMGSQGNGLISRGVIYNVVKALETYEPENILVGVMWSGSNRHDYRCRDVTDLSFVKNKIHNGWIENPTNFVPDGDKNWVILNINWTETKNVEAETYYRMFHDEMGSAIYSLEHINRTQDFLQRNNIKYFFTDYVNGNLILDHHVGNPEVDYLYKLIDKSKYLPVMSEFDWLVKNTAFSHLWKDKSHRYWEHPTTEMHKEFVDQVIYPFLLQNNYIIV